jgi:hypothetical protein
MYKSKGVGYFEFDLEDSGEVKQSDEDDRRRQARSLLLKRDSKPVFGLSLFVKMMTQ